MSSMDLAEFLMLRAKKLNLCPSEIAIKSNISRQTWYRIINSDVKQAKIETLGKVAFVLQVELIDLVRILHK